MTELQDDANGAAHKARERAVGILKASQPASRTIRI